MLPERSNSAHLGLLFQADPPVAGAECTFRLVEETTLLSLRRKGLLVEAGDCDWAGQQNCDMWRNILAFSGVLVALDTGAMIVSSFVGRAFEQSPKRSLRMCALGTSALRHNCSFTMLSSCSSWLYLRERSLRRPSRA